MRSRESIKLYSPAHLCPNKDNIFAKRIRETNFDSESIRSMTASLLFQGPRPPRCEKSRGSLEKSQYGRRRGQIILLLHALNLLRQCTRNVAQGGLLYAPRVLFEYLVPTRLQITNGWEVQNIDLAVDLRITNVAGGCAATDRTLHALVVEEIRGVNQFVPWKYVKIGRERVTFNTLTCSQLPGAVRVQGQAERTRPSPFCTLRVCRAEVSVDIAYSRCARF